MRSSAHVLVFPPCPMLGLAQRSIQSSGLLLTHYSVEHHLYVSGKLQATLQLMRSLLNYVHTYSPSSIVRYTFIKLRELEQCGVNELAQGSTPHLFTFAFHQPCALTHGVPREIGGPIKAEIGLRWFPPNSPTQELPFSKISESTTGYTFTPYVGSFTSLGIDTK